MITQPLILAFQLTVHPPEIIIFLTGALVLGFTLHFFWNSRKIMKLPVQPPLEEGINENDNWKLKYYNDMDMQEKVQAQLREKLDEAKENEQILNIELEEVQKQFKYMKPATSTEPAVAPKQTSQDDYLSQLRSAQENLFQHNQHINRLLEQIQLLKDSERKYMDLHKLNEELHQQIADLHRQVAERETEINHIRQQQRISDEMTERMDKAYAGFNILQEKLQKLESYLAKPHSKSIDYEELHDSYFKLTKDFDEVKARQISLWDENQRLSRILSDTEDKLKEANFNRQQLQKKTSFLEDLNKDLQEVSEHSKKLESQLKRISDMESLLTKTTAEK